MLMDIVEPHIVMRALVMIIYFQQDIIMVPKETISIFHIIQVELVKMLVTVDQDNMLQLQLQVPQLIHRQRVQLPQV